MILARNISKKTRKKIMKILKAHFHQNNIMEYTRYVPFDSSPCAAIWETITVRGDGFVIGKFVVDNNKPHIPLRYRYYTIASPEQIFNPRANIDIVKQIVSRLQQRGQLYALHYTWKGNRRKNHRTGGINND